MNPRHHTPKGACSPDELHDWARGITEIRDVCWCESCEMELMADEKRVHCPICKTKLERI